METSPEKINFFFTDRVQKNKPIPLEEHRFIFLFVF
jgi:hypothetical protein